MRKVKAFLVAIVVVVLYQFIIPESIIRWALNLTYHRGWLAILIGAPILIHLFSYLLLPIQAGVIWSIRKCTSNNAEVGFTMRIIAVGMILTCVMSVCSLWMLGGVKEYIHFLQRVYASIAMVVLYFNQYLAIRMMSEKI